MKYTPRFKYSWLNILVLTFFMGCTPKSDSTVLDLQSKFSNSLNLVGTPTYPKDRLAYSFSDMGAWHSYALSSKPSGGFVGPYLMTDDNGIWLSDQLVTLNVRLGDQLLDWKEAKLISNEYMPGKLKQVYQTKDITINQVLIFLSNRSTLVQYELKSSNKQPKVVSSFTVDSWLEDWVYSIDDGDLLVKSDSSNTIVQIRFDNALEGKLSTNAYYGQEQEFDLNTNFPVKLQFVQSAFFTPEERQIENELIAKALSNPSWVLANNQKRWNENIGQTLLKVNGESIEQSYELLAVKSLNTLVNNWRSSAGELKHDGLFPSYAYGGFHGFWAWDSWKHSVGLVDIVPALAKDQILAMYDYQDIDGMIADCIFRDTLIEKHNWRDTKPPLSGWAIAKVFESTNDTAFVQELYPKLKKYHQWWYEFRDHDQNGLCEYGSTDGTRVAAAWESGMDNAVRFDEATMLSNEDGGYSLDQESVDLNAYLFKEKIYLAQLAKVLGFEEEVAQYEEDAGKLSELIKSRFYHEELGFFFDVMLDDKTIQVFGPEGWIPLWAGLATKEQTAAVVSHILDSTKFNTKVPFPTLDASHDKFNPKNGYWRGPVWLDQVFFAIKGLEKYGYVEEAEELRRKLFNNAEGLIGDGPIHENYHPMTGEGLNAKHFSWSAAHLLLLIRE